MINLTGTDEEVARQVLADYGGEGDEGFNKTLTQPLLYGAGGAKKDPERYARICGIVAGKIETFERQATYLLEAANGTRRVRGTWDGQAFNDLMKEAGHRVALLPENPRRRRLEELHAYHGGIAFRELGEFDKAAKAQEQAASLAPDMNSAGISLFCAAVEWAHHAIKIGDPELIVEKLEALRAAVPALMALMALDGSGDNTEVRRWQLVNCPAHLLYAHWLAGETYDGWQADLETMQSLPEDLAETFKNWTEVLSAIDSVGSSETGSTPLRLADDVMRRGGHPSTTALAMLLAARMHRANELLGLAEVMLQAIVNLPGHGAHFVRAVAKRELAALEAAKS